MSEALQHQIRHLRSLEGSPRDPDGRIFLPLAEAHLRSGDLAEAERLLEDGLDRHPEFVAAHVLSARLRAAMGDEEGAEMAYAAARRLDPENVEVLHGLGSILAARGEEIGALLVEKARGLDPTVGGAGGATAVDGDVVSIAELAPEPEVVSIASLAPDDVPDDVVSIADLAPDPEPSVEALAPDAGEAEEEIEAPEVVDASDEGGPDREPLVTPAIETHDAGATDDAAADEHEAPPPPATAAPPVRPAAQGGLATRTLAELLVAQGQTVQAVEMYERLAAANPDDVALAERLSELRSKGETSEEPEAGHDSESPADEEAGPPIGDYLGGLLGYTPSERADDA